jgi:pyruvate dehydrogenase E1 component beta subunit
LPTMNIIQAVNSALRLELKRDDRVVLLGEDVGAFGGVFRATTGLQKEFGLERVIDTPLNESGIVGTAIGMALYGLKPVAEIQFADFSYPAFDQITNELAKYRYRSGGQYPCPVVIRMPVGGGIKGGHYHSQSNETYYAHTAGLQVVIPSTPYDAKGMLASAIRGTEPVIFMEPKRVYRAAKGDVPAEEYLIPIGKAKVLKEGYDVTIITYGAVAHTVIETLPQMEAAGIDAEIIDLRSLIPLDIDAIVASVEKTGRCVIVHEAPRTVGFGAELSALVTEKCFLYLEAPVLRVTGFDIPFPYALEHEYLPDSPRIMQALEATVHF